jgi:hypothetical protein
MVTYKYPRTALPREAKKHCCSNTLCWQASNHPYSLFGLARPRVSKFQPLAPTVRASKNIPAMAPKKATSKVATSIDDVAKVALLAEKKRRQSSLTISLVKPLGMRQSTTSDIAKRIHQPQRAPFAHAAMRDYLGHLR